MSLRLSRSNIASARSWPSRRASRCASSRLSSNARRFAEAGQAVAARQLGDLREDLGAADRAADLDAIACRKRASRASKLGRSAVRAAQIWPQTASPYMIGTARQQCLPSSMQQLALDLRQVGIVERAEVRAAVLDHGQHHVVALELVDLVVGAALLAGREIADVDQRADDARCAGSQRSIDSDEASIAPSAASAATSSTSSIRCAAATAVATEISATSSRSRLSGKALARARRRRPGRLTSVAARRADSVEQRVDDGGVELRCPAQRRSSASAASCSSAVR